MTNAIALRPIRPEDARPPLPDLRLDAHARSSRSSRWTDEQKDAFLPPAVRRADGVLGRAVPERREIDHRGRTGCRRDGSTSSAGRRRSGSSTSRSCRTSAGGASGPSSFAGLFAEAARAGRAVTIHVEIFNPARALYERLGFAVEGRAGDVRPDGMEARGRRGRRQLKTASYRIPEASGPIGTMKISSRPSDACSSAYVRCGQDGAEGPRKTSEKGERRGPRHSGAREVGDLDERQGRPRRVPRRRNSSPTLSKKSLDRQTLEHAPHRGTNRPRRSSMKTTRKSFLATVATGLAAAALMPSTLLGAGPGAPRRAVASRRSSARRSGSAASTAAIPSTSSSPTTRSAPRAPGRNSSR